MNCTPLVIQYTILSNKLERSSNYRAAPILPFYYLLPVSLENRSVNSASRLI